MHARLVALAGVCGALAACGAQPSPAAQPVSVSTTTASDVRIVPWLDAPVPDTAQPFTIPGIPACHASDLTFSAHVADPSYVNAGPVNTSFWVVSITPRGASRCFIGAAPQLFFSAAGSDLHIPRRPPVSGGNIIYLGPNGSPAPYYGRARGEIDVTPCVLHSVDRITLDLGVALGTVAADPGPPGGTGVACPAPQEAYSVALYGDTGSGVSGGVAAMTRIDMSAPSVVHPGETVHFTVTIVNVWTGHSLGSPRPMPTITFQPCPTYHVELEGVPGSFHTYRVNCAATAPIPPDGRETFAMQITVPADARPGPASLAWTADTDPAVYGMARWDLEIA